MAKARSKYNATIVRKIMELKRTGDHTNKQICDAVKISVACLQKWRDEIEEFSDQWEEASREHLSNLKDMALTGLALALKGTTYEEKTVEYKSVKVVDVMEDIKTGIKTRTERHEPIKASEKITQKVILPNMTAIIFTLTNREPTVWKNKQDHTLKPEDGVTFFSYLKDVNQVDATADSDKKEGE